MGKKFIIALDQGTTSSRCILFDQEGNVRSKAQKEFTQFYPKPGWVEQDAMEIWATQLGVTLEAMGAIGARPEDIAAIGITNQRETTVVWNKKTGMPIYKAIVWQCRRTAERIEQLKRDGLEEYVTKVTGLIPDAYFSGSKLEWILQNVSGAREEAEKGNLLFGTIDTWLMWKLTGGRIFATDVTNASRTMLFDIENLCWDEKLLQYFHIPKTMLPEVKMSSNVFGYTSKDILGGEIPISGVAGDQQAALFGQCCFDKGTVKNTYGTGCFTLMNTGYDRVMSKHGLLTTIASGIDGRIQYALEGSVFVAGAAIQWLRDEMRMLRTAAQSEEYCRKAKEGGNVYVVPAFAGLGAPYWNPYARGMVFGLTRGTTKEQFIRAVVESLAYQVNDLIKAMERDAEFEMTELKVDGGASANNFLMQFQADISETMIERPQCIETTALGAAYLAGLAVGYWKDLEEIRKNWQIDQRFYNRIEQEERLKLLDGWNRAVTCACIWADGERRRS